MSRASLVSRQSAFVLAIACALSTFALGPDAGLPAAASAAPAPAAKSQPATREAPEAPLPPYSPDANAACSAIPAPYRWDLSPLFASDAAWEQGRQKLLADVPGLAKYKGKLADPKALLACLELYFRLHKDANLVTLYPNLRHATALADDQAGAMMQKSLAAMSELMRAAEFIRRELLTMPQDKYAAALGAEKGLAPYRDYMDNLRRRSSRLLSPDAEKALALLGDNLWAEIDLNELPSPIEATHTELLTDIVWPKIKDEQGQEVQLTQSNYALYRRSPNREVRKGAVEAYLGTLRQYQHVMAGMLAGQDKLDVDYARARGYDSALQAYMDKDDVTTDVYENLVKTVNANAPLLHRYVELRKRALKLPDVHLYDLYVPLAAEVSTSVPFPEARREILEALKPLGPEYGKVLAEGLDPQNGWMHLYPCKDKDSGAFSSSVYGKHPYVCTNYQNALDDMSTLAHEFGHALHSDLAMKAQPYPNFRYTPFVAEIASTCNEALLSDYLVAHATDPAQKLYLLVGRLESIRTTIFRQTMFAEFERNVHRFLEAGTPVTASLLDSTYTDLLRRYYGPGYTIDPNDGMEWAYIPHFYYKYYVYVYATGLSSGIAIADRVRQQGAPAVEAYLGMLKGGCSKPPLELLKGAGVDLTKPDPIEAAMATFKRTLDEVDALIK